MKRASQGLDHDIEEAKGEVETALRTVMSRTERVIATDDKDAMLAEHANSTMPLVDDVRQYLAADALFSAVGDHDPIRYWKSAPYLANFMRGYGFNRKLDEALSHSPDKIVNIVQNHGAAFIAGQEVDRWQEIEPANAKLREQVSRLLDGGLWRLLWLPPTVPYCSLEGPFRGMEGTTKTLIFSAWNVVPDVVSGVLSYEAERRMVAGGRVRKYQDQQGQRLTLDRESSASSRAKKRTRHRLLLLLLPCLPLAAIHPLGAQRDQSEPRYWVRTRIEELLQDLPNPKGHSVDDDWEWAAPLLLDPGLQDFLRQWCDDDDLPRPKTGNFRSYVDDLLGFDLSKLGPRPPSLPKLLTDVALGSPAILAARAVASSGATENSQRRVAVQVADAFWSLFNRPAVISLLIRLNANVEHAHSDSYWRMVLRYCRQGDLQAVLDEQWHLLWEQAGWNDAESPDDVAAACAKKLAISIRPTPSRVHARVFDSLKSSKAETKHLRTIFALRFGHTDADQTDDEKPVNQDVVREAFNSPFRPFVLASTSIGQEGLDFHPWCHRIVHWDLPGNPVDLEQREGRVHRYKGHAVRANVAATWAMDAKAKWKFGDDLWRLLFKLADDAARQADESDLQPCWIAPGDTHVERHVPLLPYSREVETFQRLKRQLAAYRVAFGQPRQEELVTLLDRAGLEEAQLRDWAIDLSPPRE